MERYFAIIGKCGSKAVVLVNKSDLFPDAQNQEAAEAIRALNREADVHITNTVYWRPPGNRTPTLAEQAVCRPFVEKTISLVKPKVLLLAGGASAKSILGREEGILSLRGRWFEWAAADGTAVLPALPTLHPAFLLRQPAAKKKAWSDLLTLAERLDRPDRAP